MLLDAKSFSAALSQLEEERGIPREKIMDAIEQALAAAYKKDYGKKGQIVRAKFDPETGNVTFSQVKIVVDESTVRVEEDDEEQDSPEPQHAPGEDFDARSRYNPEHHIFIDDARKIKKDAEIDDEIIFPLETRDDYGRIAAQTAKQVIIQKIREAEKRSVLDEYEDKIGTVASGHIQRVDRGNVFVDLGRAIAILPIEEQIPGEEYRHRGRVKAYIYDVSEGPRGVMIRLSRTHPEFLRQLFEAEAPEIANEVVEIKSVAREPGSRSKIAVYSNDPRVDPVGACVGARGVRVTTVMQELAGEKIDIIEWSDDPAQFIADSLSPAKITDVEVTEEEQHAIVTVSPDQLSLAIGKGGQNVRLAVKLTGWRIDIKSEGGEEVAKVDETGMPIEPLPEVTEEKEGAELGAPAAEASDEDAGDTDEPAETEPAEEISEDAGGAKEQEPEEQTPAEEADETDATNEATEETPKNGAGDDETPENSEEEKN